MSWSLYATFKSVKAARTYVTDMKEPTPEQNYGTPAHAKALILSAIDACGITDEETIGLKIEASGYAPEGTTMLRVEPLTFSA